MYVYIFKTSTGFNLITPSLWAFSKHMYVPKESNFKSYISLKITLEFQSMLASKCSVIYLAERR